MPAYEISDKKTIAHLFDGWNEAMILSCLHGCMGIAYADSLASPRAAQIGLGDFCFFAGAPNDDLIRNNPATLRSGYAILVPQNDLWAKAIASHYKEKATPRLRYATKKEPDAFDKATLHAIVSSLPAPYELKPIDRALYEETSRLGWAKYLCINYETYESFCAHGLGFAVLKNNAVVCGASSYAWFAHGIEIQIDTRKDERRNGLASVCAARLILECLACGRYPNWDAHNEASLALAQKLGYRFDKTYPVYELKF